MTPRSLNALFTTHFKRSAEAAFFAPGRINLMGEHTDYNQGVVVSVAINLGSYLLVALREDEQMNLIASAFPDEPKQWSSSSLIPQDNEFDWSNYLRSLNENLVMQFGPLKGMDIFIASDLPIGSGLSSSFSVLVAFAEAVSQLNNLGLSPLIIAQLCLQTKRQLSSVVAQLSEPLTIASGKAGHALLIDCQDNRITPIKLPDTLAILIVDPRQPKGFVTSAFLQRKSQCETAAKAFGLTSLRELNKADLVAAKETLDEVVFHRALHVVTENSRGTDLASQLFNGNMVEISRIMAESQRSLKEDLDVTTESIDFIAAELQALLGKQGGVHLTGGGFGGSLAVVLEPAKISDVKTKITDLFASRLGGRPIVLEVSAGQGVSRLDINS